MERNLSLDILRIMACIAVIMIHTAGSPIVHGFVSPGSMDYNCCLILDALSRWSVPVFAMLTGFFMLDTAKELPIKKLFSKYILRLFTALVFWSVFYAITLHKSFYPLGSQEGHFWYVGMCIGLYLAVPIMRMIAANERLLSYFCWTWLVIKCYQFIGNFTTLPINLRDVIFVDYVGYCLSAYYLKTFTRTKNIRTGIYILGILGTITTILAPVLSQNDDTVFFNYTAPNVIVTAIALLTFFMHHPISLRQSWANVITTISKCTFGIYLVHMWVLIQIFFRLHRFIPNSLILCFVCVPVVFLTGGGISLIMSKLRYFNKYII